MDASQLLDELHDALIQMDECFINNDTNTVLKKVHESIAKIKQFKEQVNE